jgi:hypothetical protein
VLETGFLYEHRGRPKAGADGLIELRDPGSGSLRQDPFDAAA